MDITKNLERARKLTEDWPTWKRDYQLTKDSESRQLSPVPQPQQGSMDNQTSATCHVDASH